MVVVFFSVNAIQKLKIISKKQIMPLFLRGNDW